MLMGAFEWCICWHVLTFPSGVTSKSWLNLSDTHTVHDCIMAAYVSAKYNLSVLYFSAIVTK